MKNTVQEHNMELIYHLAGDEFICPLVPWFLEKLLRTSLINDRPLIHKKDGIRKPLRLEDIMRYHKNRHRSLLPQTDDHVLDNFSIVRVQGCGRFIKEEDLRLKHDCPRYPESLSFPA